MSFDNSYTAVTGATYQASDYNTGTKGNFTAVWVGTTAGDMDYYTSATTKSRLAKGTALQYLRMNSGATAPEWAALIAPSGLFHTKGAASTNTASNTTSTTYAQIGAGPLKIDLVLTATCTIYAFAVGTFYTSAATYYGYLAFQINSVTDAYGDNIRIKSTIAAPAPVSCMSVVSGVPAGTRRVELLWKTENASQNISIISAVMYAFAVTE